MKGTEYLRRLKALESVRLASEVLPPMGVGFMPDEGSGWNLVVVSDEDAKAKTIFWYVTDLGMQMLDEPDVAVFDEEIEQIGWIKWAYLQQRSTWKGALSLTVFLPLCLILGILRFPSRPGSPYTVGQVVLGFGAVLAIAGFIFGIFTQRWVLVGVSAYWWIGAKLIESEARARGYFV